MSRFQLIALDEDRFSRLFERSDAELAALGALRRKVTEYPGFPCRVSLEDAVVGDEVLLLPHVHHDVDSPYRASGPVFVRRSAQQARPAICEVPEYVTRRRISLRSYDASHMMVAAEVCEGVAVAADLQRLFDDDAIAYIHLHNAGPGCYSCQAVRA